MKLSISEHFHNKENNAPKRPDKEGELSNRWAMGAFKTTDFTPQQVIDHMKAGKAICVAALEKNWRGEPGFLGSEIMGIDFDHSPGVAKLLEDPFIKQYAFYVYPTPSHTDAAPRSRALFALDAPVTGYKDYKRLVTRLLANFGQLDADPQCKDPSRIFYGSDIPGKRGVNTSKRLPVAVLESLPKTKDELRAEEFRERPVTVYQPASSEVERYAQNLSKKVRQRILDEALANNVEGYRHHAFITAVWQLVAKQKGGWLNFDADSDARYLGSVMDREDEEVEAALRGAERKVEPDWFDPKLPEETTARIEEEPDFEQMERDEFMPTDDPTTAPSKTESRPLQPANLLTAIDMLRTAIRDKSRSDTDIEHLITQTQGLVDQVSMGLSRPTIVSFSDLTAQVESDAVNARNGNKDGVIGLRLNASGNFELNTHTGFPKTETIIGGLPDDLTIVLGATGSGKSWTCTSFARELLMQMSGIIVTTEMKPLFWLRRLIASAAGVPYTGLKHGTSSADEWKRIQSQFAEYGLMGASMLDHPSPTPRMIRAAIQQQMDTDSGVGWLIVDSASKMSYPGASGIYDRMSGVMNGLQDIAREFNIPVIASLQTSGDIESRGKGNRVPRMNDAYGGMVAVQNAGIVIALYNHEYYVKRELEDANFDMPAGTIAVRMLKIRDEDDSEAPVVRLKWQGAGYREWRTQTVNLNTGRQETVGY